MLRVSHIIMTVLLVCLLSGPVRAAADPHQRTVVDMAGRQVSVPREIRRVVTAGGTPAVNAFIATLGRGDRWKYQRLFIPAADGPVVSGMGPGWVPDLEALRAVPTYQRQPCRWLGPRFYNPLLL